MLRIFYKIDTKTVYVKVYIAGSNCIKHMIDNRWTLTIIKKRSSVQKITIPLLLQKLMSRLRRALLLFSEKTPAVIQHIVYSKWNSLFWCFVTVI